MVRSIAGFSVSFALSLLMTGAAAGQSAVEYAAGAARATTTAAPARGIGKSISGLAGSLEKAVKGEQNTSDTPAPAGASSKKAAATTSASAHVSASPEPTWEDPNGIQTGLSYGDLLRRFGPPAMEITDGVGKSLTYSGKKTVFQLQVQDGKVTAIDQSRS